MGESGYFDKYDQAEEYAGETGLPLWNTNQLPYRWYVGELTIEMEEDCEDWELLLENFDAMRRRILNSDIGASQLELKRLAVEAGLDKKTAHLLVSAVVAATKKSVIAEVRRQVDNLVYWVERA